MAFFLHSSVSALLIFIKFILQDFQKAAGFPCKPASVKSCCRITFFIISILSGFVKNRLGRRAAFSLSFSGKFFVSY
ncbi:hypothetical protein CL3_31960 [butyrate-producing bacterium SM4/1]|nr:hypothetical protein CLOM621_07940 [Clostridium sp. M62/1]CBK78023.1 hypothetical protein CLS_26670 [[Clostridium] cf. saccharolyticum K10]CBL36968.1 hypothetical protein CL3_31960 [butyrate-producing bacterium SM4/1]